MPRSKIVSLAPPSSYSAEASVVAKRALYSGAIGAAGSYLLFGEGAGGVQASLLDMPLNSAVVVGASVGAGSVVSDLLSDYLINSLDQSDGIKTVESTAIKAGVSGVGTVASLKVLSGIEPSANSFLLGSASKLIGDMTYNSYDSYLIGQIF